MCENVVILLSVYIPQALFEKTLPTADLIFKFKEIVLRFPRTGE
jgi:hypothetical protein